MFSSNVLETVPKVAAYQTLKAKGRGPLEDIASTVRHSVGTPPRRPGKAYHIYNNIFMFSEMFKEGWRNDMDLMKHPKTRIGWWVRTGTVALVPAIVKVLAEAGYFGDEPEKGLEAASEYLKTNYIVAPIGEDENGKAVLFTMPLPDTQRAIHGLAYKLLAPWVAPLRDLREGRTPRAPDYSGSRWEQIFALGEGALPSFAPGIEFWTNWASYLTGGSPRDSFRNQDILLDDERKAGGMDKLMPMLRWTANETGFVKLDLHTRPDAPESTLQTTLQLTPGFNRFLRVTDYGIAEKAREAARPAEAKLARERLDKRDLFATALEEGASAKDTIKQAFAGKKVTRQQIAANLRSFNEQKGALGDPLARTLRSMKEWEPQVAAAEDARHRYSPEEFQEYIRELFKAGILTRRAYRELKAD
jgi:hypothetical protein